MMIVIPRRIERKISIFNQRLKTEWYLDYGAGYRDSIFLAGVSRSGTTWLSDILNYKNQYRYMFEPFYHEEVAACKNLHPRRYLRENSKDEEFTKVLLQVLSGNARSYWSDRFNSKFISNKRLIKAIRANLFLGWLHNNFPDLPIIFLIRHPMAVSASKIRLGWRRSLQKYLNQPDLVEDFLQPFYDEMKRSEERYQEGNDGFENHIFCWCIENYVPLKQFKMNDIHVVFYEQCCVAPKNEVDRLFSYLGKSYNNKILSKVNSASKLSQKDSPILTGSNLLNGWKKHLTDQQIERALEILVLFGLEKIYSQKPMPHVENLSLVMKSQAI